ncbi:MAG: 2-isopropylmalate synthase [Planctomycetes bacterium]|nr:2-isopropylmalate synthase [Planctomycetota bacterium]
MSLPPPHDWNLPSAPGPVRLHPEFLNDESLRDGLQSPSTLHPPLERKKEFLRAAAAIGVGRANLGFPAASERHGEDVAALARFLAEERLPIRPSACGRTMIEDARGIAEAAQRAGVPLVADIFTGSSAIRRDVEGWTLDEIRRRSEEVVSFLVREDLDVSYFTEDTTRADPETVRTLYAAAIGAGARRICVCDTVGHATPRGVRAVLAHVRRVVESTGAKVWIDWHGHRDRALGEINAVTALEASADGVHACALGIGERVGNPALDSLLVNLSMMGWVDRDLTGLARYVRIASEIFGVPLSPGYPVFGARASGVPASAASRVSAVPAARFGVG